MQLVIRVLTLAAALAVPALCLAAPGDQNGIYTCTDPAGRRLTSDRPIPECSSREQRVLNHDGSVQRIVPPTMTAEERAEYDAQQQRAAAERRNKQELVRRDRNLLSRYPDAAAHEKARAMALDDVRSSMQASEQRLKKLADERKPMLSEAEFYVGRTMPALLKQQLDVNEATAAAQKSLMQNQQQELERINASYDVELARLKKLWAGAAPGSLGPVDAPSR